MAEWFYEAGIGENRAALVAHGRILEMTIERDDEPGPRVGAILPARLKRKADTSGRGLVTFADGATAQLTPVPNGISEGGALVVEIIRESIPEGHEIKPARARVAASNFVPGDGPDLLARIGTDGIAVRRLDSASDALDLAGWTDALEQAASGLVTTPDLLLRIATTPAMTLIDVDGAGAPAALAVAGAHAAGEAIRRFGIAGSIGIDLPTLASKADRQAAAAALDAVLPRPFERTAVNGFGFLQIVRRRARPSLIEQLAADPARAGGGGAAAAGGTCVRSRRAHAPRAAAGDRAYHGATRLDRHARAADRRAGRLAGGCGPRHICRTCQPRPALTDPPARVAASRKPRPTSRFVARGAATAT